MMVESTKRKRVELFFPKLVAPNASKMSMQELWRRAHARARACWANLQFKDECDLRHGRFIKTICDLGSDAERLRPWMRGAITRVNAYLRVKHGSEPANRVDSLFENPHTAADDVVDFALMVHDDAATDFWFGGGVEEIHAEYEGMFKIARGDRSSTPKVSSLGCKNGSGVDRVFAVEFDHLTPREVAECLKARRRWRMLRAYLSAAARVIALLRERRELRPGGTAYLAAKRSFERHAHEWTERATKRARRRA